ncbi:MAG: hypothetical protein QMC82_03440 [Methanolinea sp.]|jgi:hypothetical protein|nr:hypothetical protein [Methanolinea sp.]
MPDIPVLGNYLHTTRQEGPVYSSSITIGTPAKGGEVKVYFDPADPVDAEKRIREAFRLRALARALAEGQEVHA